MYCTISGFLTDYILIPLGMVIAFGGMLYVVSDGKKALTVITLGVLVGGFFVWFPYILSDLTGWAVPVCDN